MIFHPVRADLRVRPNPPQIAPIRPKSPQIKKLAMHYQNI